jgi:hypothetical protein
MFEINGRFFNLSKISTIVKGDSRISIEILGSGKDDDYCFQRFKTIEERDEVFERLKEACKECWEKN